MDDYYQEINMSLAFTNKSNKTSYEGGTQLDRKMRGVDREKNILGVNKKLITGQSTKKISTFLIGQPQKNIFNPFPLQTGNTEEENRDGKEYCEMLYFKHDLTFVQQQ